LGEDDAEIAKDFLKYAHEKNFKQEQVATALNWWHKNKEEQIATAQRLDSEHRDANSQKLKEEWGGDFDRNLNILKSFMETAPEGLKDNLMSARMPNGERVGNNIEALRFLVGVAREINPTATVVPGSGAGAESNIVTEMAKLESMMGDHSSEYWKGPMAEQNQKRYLELTNAKLTLDKRK
jgi:hypothetical protein